MDPITGAMTPDEQKELEGYECAIAQGVAGFRAAGEALEAVRDRRLYRADYATFEDYCHGRWGFSRTQGYRLIEAAKVVRDLAAGMKTAPPTGWRGGDPVTGDSFSSAPILPANERQARAIAQAPPEHRSAVWGAAVERAGEKAPSASYVKELIAKAQRYGFGVPPRELAQAVRREEEEAKAAGALVEAEQEQELEAWWVAKARWHLSQVRRHLGKAGFSRMEMAQELDDAIVGQYGDVAPRS